MEFFVHIPTSRDIDIQVEEPIYLMSNTNALDVESILALFRKEYPEYKINFSPEQGIKPVAILPNVYLCLSYRYKAFKTETVSTVSLLEQLFETSRSPITLVSQYKGDLDKAQALGIATIYKADDFFDSKASVLSIKNGQ